MDKEDRGSELKENEAVPKIQYREADFSSRWESPITSGKGARGLVRSVVGLEKYEHELSLLSLFDQFVWSDNVPDRFCRVAEFATRHASAQTVVANTDRVIFE